MVLAGHRLALPSNDEYSVPQLRMMLREVEAILGRPVPTTGSGFEANPLPGFAHGQAITVDGDAGTVELLS